MSQAVLSGGCLCGAVRYEVRGAGANPCYCHCASCRRAVGAPGVPWVSFAHESFRVTRGTLAEYRSSAAVLRGFCRDCGTSLTYRNERRPAEIDLTLATLDAAAQLAPQMHVWCGERLPWELLSEALPKHVRGVG